MKIIEVDDRKMVIQKRPFAYVYRSELDLSAILFFFIVSLFGTSTAYRGMFFQEGKFYPLFYPLVFCFVAFLVLIVWLLYVASSSPDILTLNKIEGSADLKRKRWLLHERIKIAFSQISLKIKINRNGRVNDYTMVFKESLDNKSAHVLFSLQDIRTTVSHFLEIEVPNSCKKVDHACGIHGIHICFEEVPTWGYRILEQTSTRLRVREVLFNKETGEVYVKKSKYFIHEISDVFLMIYDEYSDIEITLLSGKKLSLGLHLEFGKHCFRDMQDMANIIRQFLNINSSFPLVRYEDGISPIKDLGEE